MEIVVLIVTLLYYVSKYNMAYGRNPFAYRAFLSASPVPLLTIYLVATLTSKSDTVTTGATLLGIGVIYDSFVASKARGIIAATCAAVVVMSCQLRDGHIPVGILGIISCGIAILGSHMGNFVSRFRVSKLKLSTFQRGLSI